MKNSKLFITILIIACVLGVLCSCTERENEDEKPYITISFDTGFDDLKIDDVRLYLDQDAYMPEDPFKAGYKFLGWYYDKAGTREFFIANGFTANTTLYAKWEQKTSELDEDTQNDPTIEKDTEGFSYKKLTEDTYSIVSYVGDVVSLALPLKYNGKDVVKINSGAFSKCSKLTTISVSKNINTIEEKAFCGVSTLQRIEVDTNNVAYSSINGMLFDKAQATILRACPGLTQSYTIPNNVNDIGPYCFEDCTYQVILPTNGTITYINHYAFGGYKGSITINSAVQEIWKNAFYKATCEVLFTTDCAINQITDGAFDSYLGDTLELNANVNEISSFAFSDSTATIDLSKTGLTALGNNAFYGYAGDTITIPYFITSIGKNCFGKVHAEVNFGENTTYENIGEQSFAFFNGKVVFPTTVKTIGKYAFYQATKTAQISFSCKESDLNIDEKAFNGYNKSYIAFAK